MELKENKSTSVFEPVDLHTLLISDARPNNNLTLNVLCEKRGIILPIGFRLTWFDISVLSLFQPIRFKPNDQISYEKVAWELTQFFKGHGSEVTPTAIDIFNYFRVFKGLPPGKAVTSQNASPLTEDSFPEVRGIYNAIMMYETLHQAKNSQFPHYKRDLQYIVASCYVRGMNGSGISRLLMDSPNQQVPKGVIDCMILDMIQSFPRKIKNVLITTAHELLYKYPSKSKELGEYLKFLKQGKYLTTPRRVHGDVHNYIKTAVCKAWLENVNSRGKKQSFFKATKSPHVRVSIEGYIKGGPGEANNAFQREFGEYGVGGERGSMMAKIALGGYFNGIPVIDMIDRGYNFLQYRNPDFDHSVKVTKDYDQFFEE